MAANYARLISSEMEALPVKKQAEVYDFVKFLKSGKADRHRPIKKSSSMQELVGICKSDVTDLAKNHDKYLYD